MNILSNPSSPSNKNKKKRRSPQIVNEFASSSDIIVPKVEIHQSTSSLIQSTFPIPPIDTRNPVTWNVNDVCSYLNQSGCSFALKTIKEQVKKNTFFYLFKYFFHLFFEGNRWCCSSSS
jgi:hypothetical protein